MKSPQDQMSNAQAQELIRRWKTDGDREALNSVIVGHLDVAKFMANRSLRSGEPFDDLFQVATLSLWAAVEAYEPECGKFSSLAGEIMRRDIIEHLSLRMPTTIKTTSYRRYAAFGGKVPLNHGRRASEEICADLQRAAAPPLLLDDLPADDPFDLEDPTKNAEERLIALNLREQLKKAVDELPFPDREIIAAVYIEGVKCARGSSKAAVLAKRFGVSERRAKAILKESLAKLKARLTDGNA